MIGSEKPFACIIWGGYGHGNTGDEMCLAAALKRKEREFNGSVAVLSHRPAQTLQLFPKANVIPYFQPDPKSSRLRRRLWRNCQSLLTESGRNYLRRNLRFDPGSEWQRCLSGASHLYLAGGGYLTDLFSLDFVMPPIELAVKLKLPLATAPLGLGPFESGLAADRVVKALRRSKLIVRDTVSLDFCRRHGLVATSEPDDAFALAKQMMSPISGEQRGVRPRKIGVCIFQQYGQETGCDLSEWWVECLRGLKACHPEFEIEGFCFHTSLPAEYQEMTRLFLRAGLSPNQVLAPEADFRRAVSAIRNYDFIIATRFHAVVAANVFNIPNIAIAAGEYYHAKMTAATSGYESFSRLLNPVGKTPQILLDICQQALPRRRGGGAFGRITGKE